jgi:hypothetical protein
MVERIVCECGARLARPVPLVCPECQRLIRVVHRPLWSRVWPVLAIAALFGVLIGYLVWLLGRL